MRSASRFLERPPPHLCALALSLAAHVVLGCAIVTWSGFGESGWMPGATSASMVRVQLQPVAGGLRAAAMQPVADQRRNTSTRTLVKSTLPVFTAPSTSRDAPKPGIATPLVPHYYKLSELTQKPFVLQDVPQILPPDLPTVRPQSAVVRLLINAHGGIDKVAIEASNLPDEVERFIVESFSKTRFYPGKIDGVAVNSQMRIEVNLEQTGPQ